VRADGRDTTRLRPQLRIVDSFRIDYPIPKLKSAVIDSNDRSSLHFSIGEFYVNEMVLILSERSNCFTVLQLLSRQWR
jgi:hypothetical protein